MTRAAAVTSTLVAILIVSACGSARISRAPLVALPAVEAGGSGVRQLGPVAIVEYTPTRNFGIAFVVTNRSGRRITVTGVSSTDPGRRFLRLVGAEVAPYSPPSCPRSCPAPSLGLDNPDGIRPRPFEALTIPNKGKEP